MTDTLGLGLREGLLIAAGLAAIYLVFLWLRLSQLRRHRARSVPEIPPAQPIRIGPEWSAPLRETPATERSTPEPNLTSEVGGAQDLWLMKEALQNLRAEFSDLQSDFESVRAELELLKAARHVSPLYNEAMSFAQKGLDAVGIASRCGISIAEAELVTALAKKPEEMSDVYLDEENHDQSARRRVA